MESLPFFKRRAVYRIQGVYCSWVVFALVRRGCNARWVNFGVKEYPTPKAEAAPIGLSGNQ